MLADAVSGERALLCLQTTILVGLTKQRSRLSLKSLIRHDFHRAGLTFTT